MPKWIEPQVNNNPITCSNCLHGINYVGTGAKTRCASQVFPYSCCSKVGDAKKCVQTLYVCSKSFKCDKNLWVKPRNFYRTVECKHFLEEGTLQ